jgi:hypothetical protein
MAGITINIIVSIIEAEGVVNWSMPQFSLEHGFRDRGCRGWQLRSAVLWQHIKRAVSGLPIILLSSFALIEGAKLCAFASLGGREDHFIRAEDSRTAALVEWTKITGVRSDALGQIISLKAEAGARAAESAMPFARVNTDLAALLSIRPMWGRYWMLYAEVRLMVERTFGQALSAFRMAELTAPREADVMLERVKFGFLFWELLPPESRNQSTSSLVAMRPILDLADYTAIKDILGMKDDEVRADIRTRLRGQASDSVTWLNQVGL